MRDRATHAPRWWLLVWSLLAVACRKPITEEHPGALKKSCEVTQQDCDNNPANGCEAHLGSAQSCGGCEQRCAQGERCIGGTCQPTSDIAMSNSHTCWLGHTGRVHCWGANESGEVGDGTLLMRDRPVLVPQIEDAVQLAVREHQTCVRRRSGVVSCWGEAFGTGRPGTLQPAPTEVEELKGASTIALSRGVFCGLLPERGILCLPSSGQDKAVPRVGPPPGAPVSDAVDLAATAGQLCALRREGTVICWDMAPFEDIPPEKRQQQVHGVKGALSLNAGKATVCALREGGKATCWGGGIVTTPGTIRDVMVGGAHDFSTLGGVSDLAFLGWPHDNDCAARLDGSAVCWAPPSIDPKDLDSRIEVKTTALDLPPIHRIDGIFSDRSHCALTRKDEVYCWGLNTLGRLGIGRPPEQPTPQIVPGVRGVRELVASGIWACARTDSDLQCWGGGKEPHPVKVPGLDRLLNGQCASIRGELVCFEEPFERALPSSGLRDVVQLIPAAEGSHILSYFALHRDGKVSRVDWKRANRSGEPGWTRTVLAPLRGLKGVRELLDGDHKTCVREGPNEMLCWNSIGDPIVDQDGQISPNTQRYKLPEGFEQIHLLRVLDDEHYEACGVQGGKVACWDNKLTPRWTSLSKVRRLRGSPRKVLCASLEDGSLHCWSTWPGTITGHGSLKSSQEPAAVPGIVGVADFAVQQPTWDGQDAIFVWQRDGRLLAWGRNGTGERTATQGQLGWVAPPKIDRPTLVELPTTPP